MKRKKQEKTICNSCLVRQGNDMSEQTSLGSLWGFMNPTQGLFICWCVYENREVGVRMRVEFVGACLV